LTPFDDSRFATALPIMPGAITVTVGDIAEPSA